MVRYFSPRCYLGPPFYGQPELRSLSATAAAFLNWRAWHRSVGAEYAAIAIFRLQPGAAALAVVEKLTRVGRHALDRLDTAVRAADDGFHYHVEHHIGFSALKNTFLRAAARHQRHDWCRHPEMGSGEAGGAPSMSAIILIGLSSGITPIIAFTSMRVEERR